MWSFRYLSRIDFMVLPIIFGLMVMSLLILSSSTTEQILNIGDEGFFTPVVMGQIKRYFLGAGCYLFFAAFDYNKLREWTWILYLLVLMALVGVFFTDSIARVHRWYRIPLIGMSVQPSEFAKLIVVMSLSWFLERNQTNAWSWRTIFNASLIVGIPFILILKQPDLGTAIVLFPITLVMFYIGNLRRSVVKAMCGTAVAAVAVVALFFLEIIPHEQARPFATLVLKEYQFDRLNPHTDHQKAAATAIALGGMTGSGFRKGEFTRGGWLPAPYTDSVFPAFAEEWGFIGVLTMLTLFYGLIYRSFQVAVVTADPFGRLLAAGVTVYIAMHILVNIGMMSGFLPITGVPLPLITFGGSSILLTMTALGILQSVYSRRFMF